MTPDQRAAVEHIQQAMDRLALAILSNHHCDEAERQDVVKALRRTLSTLKPRKEPQA